MKKLFVVMICLMFVLLVFVQVLVSEFSVCEVKVVDKYGKLLVGVVKDFFIKKCEKFVEKIVVCEVKVVSKDGKLFLGVVKNLLVKKCMSVK